MQYSNDVAEENIQSRIRGLMLMALSNKTNSLLIATTGQILLLVMQLFMEI